MCLCRVCMGLFLVEDDDLPWCVVSGNGQDVEIPPAVSLLPSLLEIYVIQLVLQNLIDIGTTALGEEDAGLS